MKRGMCTLTVALAVGLASAGHAEIPLFSCGGTIPAGKKGVLQNDVVCSYRCSGAPNRICNPNGNHPCRHRGRCEADVFVLGNGATLDLNGHKMELAYQASGARCGDREEKGRCTVKGPGTFDVAKGAAVASFQMDLFVKDVTIGGGDYAIFTRGRLRAEGVTVLSDRENTIYAEKGVIVRDSELNGEAGVDTDGDVQLYDVIVGPRGGGIVAGGAIRGRDVELRGTTGLTARDVALRRVTAVPDPTISFPPYISAERRLRLVDSSVPRIESGVPPVLVRTTCEKSEIYPGIPTWNVCSGD